MPSEFDPSVYLTSNAWPFEEARRVAAHLEAKLRQPGYTDKGYVLFETGYGPSGLPHIGTFGEVFRTSLVRFAFEKMHPGTQTRLFAFSDDLDGLRKVPENVPNKPLLIANLHKPLSRIPDPYEQYPSFAHHNNAMLRGFLDRFGFAYEFLSSTEEYTSGRFDAALRGVLAQHQAIVDIIVPTLGDERAASYSPFLPIDAESGQVLQVPVISMDVTGGTFTYRRADGREVQTPVTGGHCKLQWKADWAMRWTALDVDYEMSGKDLIDSVQLGSRICRQLGGTPPVNLTYEHFVDEHGAKISKSKGNGLTIEEWLGYAPAESLSLYMYRTPTRQKKLFKALIPTVVDEYASLLEAFPTQTPAEQLENPVWHIHQGQPPASPLPVPYGMLLNLISVTGAESPDLVWRYLGRYRPDLNPANSSKLNEIIRGGLAYYQSTIKPTQAFHNPTDETERAALQAIITYLHSLTGDEDAETIQTGFYDLGKQHFGKERLRDWFGFLYRSLLGFPQGPRLGGFVKVYGIPESIALVETALHRQP